jgi:hypothetical protein
MGRPHSQQFALWQGEAGAAAVNPPDNPSEQEAPTPASPQYPPAESPRASSTSPHVPLTPPADTPRASATSAHAPLTPPAEAPRASAEPSQEGGSSDEEGGSRGEEASRAAETRPEPFVLDFSLEDGPSEPEHSLQLVSPCFHRPCQVVCVPLH